jgi:hypothetical protein
VFGLVIDPRIRAENKTTMKLQEVYLSPSNELPGQGPRLHPHRNNALLCRPKRFQTFLIERYGEMGVSILMCAVLGCDVGVETGNLHGAE